MLDLPTIVIVVEAAFIAGLSYFLVKALMRVQTERLKAAMADKARDNEALRIDRDNWRRMAGQANIVLENRVNAERIQRGEEPFPVVAAVIPEHNSPVTPQQRDAALFATWRARLAAAALELGEEVPDVSFEHYRSSSDALSARGL